MQHKDNRSILNAGDETGEQSPGFQPQQTVKAVYLRTPLTHAKELEVSPLFKAFERIGFVDFHGCMKVGIALDINFNFAFPHIM